MKSISSELFKMFPELIFGMSTREGGVSEYPYCMNLSYSVGDDERNVMENRKIFFRHIGISEDQITFQKQVHSTTIRYSNRGQIFESCDAIFTDTENNFLAVSVADCIPVFMYEPETKVVAAIHSGWKGTAGKILAKTIKEMVIKLKINISELRVFIGPGISAKNYEVGWEVGKHFDKSVRYEEDGKYYVDLKKDNYNQLISEGVKEERIEISDLCTLETGYLHSYRRDGMKSGRMLGVIGFRSMIEKR